jgi:hypothetical protein
MHGIVWWRAADLGKHAETVLTGGPSVDPPAWSRLVTWEDQRCSQEFLATCRDRIDAAHAVEGAGGGGTPSSGLSSGYGLATFAHTLTTNPEGLAGYDACGTIHDLLAFILCGHARADEATIDTTDACSWGAFNLDTKNWNLTRCVLFSMRRVALVRSNSFLAWKRLAFRWKCSRKSSHQAPSSGEPRSIRRSGSHRTCECLSPWGTTRAPSSRPSPSSRMRPVLHLNYRVSRWIL